jgi:hypothetical protein
MLQDWGLFKDIGREIRELFSCLWGLLLKDIVYNLIFTVIQQCEQIIANLELLLTHLIIVCDIAEIHPLIPKYSKICLRPVAFLKCFWCSFCFNVRFFFTFFVFADCT